MDGPHLDDECIQSGKAEQASFVEACPGCVNPELHPGWYAFQALGLRQVDGWKYPQKTHQVHSVASCGVRVFIFLLTCVISLIASKSTIAP